MRIPSPPPEVPALTPDKIASYLHLVQEATWLRRSTQGYWSWDELRRRPIPGGISAEAAWAAVVLHRRANAKQLPLLDRGGRPFSYWLTDELIQSLLHVQSGADDVFGLRSADGVALPFERQVQRSSIIEEAIHSSLIEGAVSTRHDAKRMIQEGRTPKNQSERMILNNFRTIEMLTDLAQEPLSPDLVCRIHASLTEGTLDRAEDAGRMQTPGERRVRIMDETDQILFDPPPAEQSQERLERLCTFANASEPWVPDAVKAVLLHFQLAHDHPFVDGNGRTARALFYWFMLRRGHHLVRYLSISRIILQSKTAYARAYLHVEQTGDANYFLVYHLGVYQRSLLALGDHLRHKRSEVGEAERSLARWPELNLRQRLLLKDVLAHPERWYTARVHAGIHAVTHQTAISDLRGLVELGLLAATRRGRENVFRGADDLPKTLMRQGFNQ